MSYGTSAVLLGILAASLPNNVQPKDWARSVTGTSKFGQVAAGHFSNETTSCLSKFGNGWQFLRDNATNQLWIVDFSRKIVSRLDANGVDRWSRAVLAFEAAQHRNLEKAERDPQLAATVKSHKTFVTPLADGPRIETQTPAPNALKLSAFDELYAQLKAVRGDTSKIAAISPRNSVGCLFDMREVPFQAVMSSPNHDRISFSLGNTPGNPSNWKKLRRVDIVSFISNPELDLDKYHGAP